MRLTIAPLLVLLLTQVFAEQVMASDFCDYDRPSVGGECSQEFLAIAPSNSAAPKYRDYRFPPNDTDAIQLTGICELNGLMPQSQSHSRHLSFAEITFESQAVGSSSGNTPIHHYVLLLTAAKSAGDDKPRLLLDWRQSRNPAWSSIESDSADLIGGADTVSLGLLDKNCADNFDTTIEVLLGQDGIFGVRKKKPNRAAWEELHGLAPTHQQFSDPRERLRPVRLRVGWLEVDGLSAANLRMRWRGIYD